MRPFSVMYDHCRTNHPPYRKAKVGRPPKAQSDREPSALTQSSFLRRYRCQISQSSLGDLHTHQKESMYSASFICIVTVPNEGWLCGGHCNDEQCSDRT